MTPAPTNGSVREREEPLPFGGMPLGVQRHICAFFDNPEKEYRVLMPFIEEGIERGQGFIVDVSRTHPMRLTAGILQENRFYMPPDEFLRELQSRNPREAAAAS